MVFSKRHCILKQLKRTIYVPKSGMPITNFSKALNIEDIHLKTGIKLEVLEPVVISLCHREYITIGYIIGSDLPHYLLTIKGQKALRNKFFIWIKVLKVFVYIIGPIILLFGGIAFIKYR